ncbi:MAG TPA: polysaccharide deacetylase family protein [Candidatus Binatia bacterium]|jgi:peptidoglycan/xylan/chitin deacetylase (PgdA/CDA1 family)|nr:polysaccharide deacetylase family protein [Candidatus Binatia bacterium]
MKPKPIKWPNDAKIAVSFFVAFEAFNKSSQYRRSDDKPDYASLAYGEYGGKAGIWRVMDVFARNGVKGTIDTNGRIAEVFPDAVRELHAGGHEIVGHGWVNDIDLTSLDAQKEKELIKRTLDSLASVTGKRPVGWVSPGHRINEHTFENFVDEGIYWTGDLPGPDIPEHRMISGKPLVIMPRLDYANDLSLIFNPKNPARVYFDSFKTAFDYLYAEGEAGSPKLIDALVHAHIGGRPNIIGVFEECIRYAKSFKDVWFCTKGEIAKYYLDHYVSR